MPQFTYVARDRNGNAVQGISISTDLDSVREQLRERDLYLISASEQTMRDGTEPVSFRRRTRRVKLDDLVVMSRQLATLVRAGLPIVESLHIVSQQSENRILQEVVLQMRRDILGGSSFTEAMARHNHIFSELYVALIRAGEAGGVLDETLETAADQYDKESDLRAKIKTAFTYPIIVVATAVFVVGFLVTVIIPQFDKVYKAFNAELPFITQLLINISHAVTIWWADVIIIVSVVVAAMLFRRYVRTPAGRMRWDAFKLKVWILGKLNRKIAIARFTNALSAMVRAGVPLLQALTISARVANNAVFSAAIARVAEFVQQGARLWAPMEQTGQFPPIVTRMIAAGEESGNLEEMLRELTAFYNREIDYTVQKLTRLMEPLLTIIIGGIVLFVLLALYMPIFNLSNVLKR